MNDSISNNPLEALQEIKKVMQQSSRIFSLSGWSGIWAGIVALLGSLWFWWVHNNYGNIVERDTALSISNVPHSAINLQPLYRFYLDTAQKQLLIWSALVIFVVAIAGAIFFSYKKNLKKGYAVNYNEVAK